MRWGKSCVRFSKTAFRGPPATFRKRVGDYCAFHEGVPGRADLFSLAGEFDIPVSRTHHALYDAYVTAQLLQRYLNILPQHGIRTVRDLRRIAKP